MRRLLKNQNGITLIVLVITIIVMIIIAAIAIRQGVSSVNDSRDSVIESNLRMVQQTVLQEYSKNSIAGNKKKYYGTKVDADKFKEITENTRLNLQNSKNPESYYILTSDDLKALGIEAPEGQEYLVDYKTGEIWDLTAKTYDNGEEYAYLSGVTNTVGQESENYKDSSMIIAIEKDLYKDSGKYKIQLKVSDEFAKIDNSEKGGGLTKKDISDGKAEIKVGDKVLKNTEVEIELTSSSDEKNGGDYIYTIIIPVSKIPDPTAIVSVTVNQDTITDVKGGGNEKTVLTTTVAKVEDPGELSWRIAQTVKYQTKLDDNDRKNGYTDPDGVTWGTSATIDLELTSENGLKKQPYYFEYGWTVGEYSNDVFTDNVIFYPNEGDKKAVASIYLNQGTGKGTLYVKPKSEYSGINTNGLQSTDIRSIGVNLDNTPPQITKQEHEDFKTRFWGGYNNKQFEQRPNDNPNSIIHLDSVLENPDAEIPQDTAKYKIIVKDGEEIGDESGIYNGNNILEFSMGISSSEKIDPDFELLVNGDLGQIKEQLDKHRNCINLGFTTKIWTDDLPSGLFYVWFTNFASVRSGEERTLTDNVGNPVNLPHKFGIQNNETKELEPYVVDLHRPELHSVSVENNIGKIIITDDYSGLSNKEDILKNIKYKWVKSRDEVPSKSELTSIDLRKSESKSNGEFGNFELIDVDRPYSFGNDTIYRTITVNVEPPKDNEQYYLYVSIDGYTDTAGNPVDSSNCSMVSDDFIRPAKDINIEVKEITDIGYPTTLEIKTSSASGKKYKLDRLYLEYDGTANEMGGAIFQDLIDEEDDDDYIYNSQSYGDVNITQNTKGYSGYVYNPKSTISLDEGYYITTVSTVLNGPVTVHLIDSDGDEFSKSYKVTNVQETILVADIREGESYKLPIKLNRFDNLFYVDWGDESGGYIIKSKEFGSIEHIYSQTKYNCKIKISGSIVHWSFDSISYNNSSFENVMHLQKAITGIEQFGIHKSITPDFYDRNYSFSDWFYECSNLVNLPEVNEINQNAFIDITGLGATFYGTGIKNFSLGYLKKAKRLWSFHKTFEYSKLEEIDVDLFETFNMNLGKEYNFYRTFANTELKEIPTGLFMGANAIEFQYTFEGTKIDSIPEDLFSANENAKIFDHTFYKCIYLKNIPANLFANNRDAYDFQSCFGYTSIDQIPKELFKAQRNNGMHMNFSSTFSNCKNLIGVDESVFKELKISNLSYCFANDNNLEADCSFSNGTYYTGINNTFFDNMDLTELTNVSRMFLGCSKLKINGTGVITANLFENCTKLEFANEIFGYNFALKNVTGNIFKNCTSLSSIGGMFFRCISLENVNENLFNDCPIADITSVYWEIIEENKHLAWHRGIFGECNALKTCPHLWDRSKFPYIEFVDDETKGTNYIYKNAMAFYGASDVITSQIKDSQYKKWFYEINWDDYLHTHF